MKPWKIHEIHNDDGAKTAKIQFRVGYTENNKATTVQHTYTSIVLQH